MGKARVKVISCENISGTSKSSGRPYSMNVVQVLDLDTFDKFKVNVPDGSAREVSAAVGKEAVLEYGQDAKTDKPYFVSFKAAA